MGLSLALWVKDRETGPQSCPLVLLCPLLAVEPRFAALAWPFVFCVLSGE